MGKNNYRFFTKEEDQIILDNYRKIGLAKVSKLIPDRTQVSIQQRARRLGVVVGKDKQKDEKSSHENKQDDDIQEPKIGKKKSAKLTGWSKEEDYQIRKHGMTMSEELSYALPGRSISAIEKRIQQLTNRRYISHDSYAYVSYPLNAYVDIYDTYLGYDKTHSRFEDILDRNLENIIKANPSKLKLANAMTRAFIMRYRDHLPSYDISRELGIKSEEYVDKLCSQCLTILKRAMIKK